MPRVLIVEDDESSRESLRAALEDAGYTVVVAADGEAALALYLEADVVVTDLVMEPIDGLQLIEKLRRVRFTLIPYSKDPSPKRLEHVDARNPHLEGAEQ